MEHEAGVAALLAQIAGFGGEAYGDDLSKCGCGHPPPYLEPPRARGWAHAPAKRPLRVGRRVSASGAVRSLTCPTVAAAVSGSAAASDYAGHAQPSVHIPEFDGPILLEFEVFFVSFPLA